MKRLLIVTLFLSGLINGNESSNKLSKEDLMKLARHAAEYHDEKETKTTLDQLAQLSKEDFNIAMKHIESGNKTTMIGYAGYFGNANLLTRILELNAKFNPAEPALSLLFKYVYSGKTSYDLILEHGCKASLTGNECIAQKNTLLSALLKRLVPQYNPDRIRINGDVVVKGQKCTINFKYAVVKRKCPKEQWTTAPGDYGPSCRTDYVDTDEVERWNKKSHTCNCSDIEKVYLDVKKGNNLTTTR